MAAEVSRCFVEWTGKAESRVTLGRWSVKRSLAPGGALTLGADYEIKKQAPCRATSLNAALSLEQGSADLRF